MIHLEDDELFKEGVIEMLENEEETEKLIIAHKDDNIILNFIYNIYAGKYKVLNKLLDTIDAAHGVINPEDIKR